MGTVITSRSVFPEPEILSVAICIFNMQPQWLRDRCCLAYILKPSESKVAVPQVCLKVYETPSGCRGIPQCLLSTQTIQMRLSGWQGVAEIPLFSVSGLLRSSRALPSLWPVWVLLSVFKGGLWTCLSPASVFRVARFAPSVSHHCFWLSPLTGNERFILSGLNYIVPSWLLVLLRSK